MQSSPYTETHNPDQGAMIPQCIPSIIVSSPFEEDDQIDTPQRCRNAVLVCDKLKTEIMVLSKQLEASTASHDKPLRQYMDKCVSVDRYSNGLRNFQSVGGDSERGDTISLSTFERASGLWFKDGSLIIHADPLIFRVSRDMLAQQSPTLEELLRPQKLATYDVLDGCPVLQVPHNPAEVSHFLAAIFKPSSFDSFFTRISFDVIVAVFRLSTIYQIPGLPRKALTLPLLRVSNKDQILPVIQFAREHSIDWILPQAFYRYSLEMTGENQVFGVEYGGAQVVMSPNDQARCHNALFAMCTTHTAAILERYVTRVSDRGCTGGATCRESRLDEGWALLQRVGTIPNVFLSWTPQANSQLCAVCLEDMQHWNLNQRESFWNDLPGLFELPDWATLNELKDAALLEGEDDEETF
ncbi:BTB domain-containing protein [Mycena venus]|uniref:BTB domain-containing protein n=1 Tax=Mycena venus TaxID=2733690 RepID=A0A8H6XE22_9AGAR|nr:BTB domain-containing protein [Mycena venus]